MADPKDRDALSDELLHAAGACGFRGGPEAVTEEEIEQAREELYRRRPELAPKQQD